MIPIEPANDGGSGDDSISSSHHNNNNDKTKQSAQFLCVFNILIVTFFSSFLLASQPFHKLHVSHGSFIL